MRVVVSNLVVSVYIEIGPTTIYYVLSILQCVEKKWGP